MVNIEVNLYFAHQDITYVQCSVIPTPPVRSLGSSGEFFNFSLDGAETLDAGGVVGELSVLGNARGRGVRARE
jgi:hypothetical protein